MKKILLFIFIFTIIVFINAKYLIRIDKSDLLKLNKTLKSLDIAGYKDNYIDLILNNEELNLIKNININYDVLTLNKTKADFLDIDEVYAWIDSLHALYPNITDIDTIGFTIENNPLIILKINGINPSSQDNIKNGFLLMALHHAREWQTVSAALFFADSILSKYNVDTFTKALIDSTFIIVFPLVNPDGYDYSRTVDNYWRKNRAYRNGAYGVDINRNYNGGLNGDSRSDWGFIFNSSTSHYPYSDVYCGPYGGSERETQAVMQLIDLYDFDITVSLHSYGEIIIFPWASVDYPAIDSIVFDSIANFLASSMKKKNSSQTYTYGQSASLYPTTGDSDDWIYGYSKCIKGKTILPFTFEIDNNFNNSTPEELDSLYRNVFNGIFKALTLCNYARENVREIPLKPTLTFSNNTLYWSLKNASESLFYTLYNYKDKIIVNDSVNNPYMYESVNFATNIYNVYSGNKSFKDVPGTNISAILMTKYMHNIKENDTLSFYIWYDLELNYDIGFVEFSEDIINWHIIDTVNAIFNGNSNGWIKKTFCLKDFKNKSGYFRIRVVYDGATVNEGVYIDNFYPLTYYKSDSVYVDSLYVMMYNIDTDYPIEQYFSVIPFAYNIGYTMSSSIISVFGAGIFEYNDNIKTISFNPVNKILYIEPYTDSIVENINIYNSLGIKVFNKKINDACYINLKHLSAGKYFIGFDSWYHRYKSIIILR